MAELRQASHGIHLKSGEFSFFHYFIIAQILFPKSVFEKIYLLNIIYSFLGIYSKTMSTLYCIKEFASDMSHASYIVLVRRKKPQWLISPGANTLILCCRSRYIISCSAQEVPVCFAAGRTLRCSANAPFLHSFHSFRNAFGAAPIANPLNIFSMDLKKTV